MLCSFCPPTIWATSLGFCRNRPESSADKMYRACEKKDQTLKRIRTLHFPEWCEPLPGSFVCVAVFDCRGLRPVVWNPPATFQVEVDEEEPLLAQFVLPLLELQSSPGSRIPEEITNVCWPCMANITPCKPKCREREQNKYSNIFGRVSCGRPDPYHRSQNFFSKINSKMIFRGNSF